MAWLNEKLRKTRETNDYSHMYFKYKSIEEVKEKFENGDVLSGLTTKVDDAETLEGHFWIAYRKKCPKINMVPIIIDKAETTSMLLCGMTYHQYLLSEDKCMLGLIREEVEELTSDYCLRLPYCDKNEEGFERLYSIVFSDWEVIDRNGRKTYQSCAPKDLW